MSFQTNFLAGAIEAARDGEESSVTLLRNICVGAAEKAPLAGLLRLGECLLEIGVGMERDQIAGN